MWRDIKCKDYNIIRFNQRPNKDAPFSILMEDARKFADFKWKMIEFLTKKERNWWRSEYMTEALDCVFDEIDEKFGIIHMEEIKWFTLLIPKDNVEFFEWLKLNAETEFRVVKKTFIGHGSIHPINTWRRTESKEFSEKMIKKFNLKL